MKKIEAIQMEMIMGGDANSFWQGAATGFLIVGGAIGGAIAGASLGPAGIVGGAIGGALVGAGGAILAL